jgi:diguanylate cyclase (GGDEF)-like protein/PAS domain S-box-containing protein
MMADFFKAQMDYVFFLYGLSFIPLVPICHFLNRRPQPRLPWVWLGLFGAAHGLNGWLDLLALDLGSGPLLDLVRSGLMTLSFLFLVEFGRAGTLTLRGRSPGRWILAALLGVAVLGGAAGLPGFCAASRYSLGLVGGLWTAGVLYLASKEAGPGKLALGGAALGMVGYALASGLVVSPAPFFPASLLNSTAFLTATGWPIQLLRALLTLWVLACLCVCVQASLAQETERRILTWGKTLMVGATAGFIALLIAGWFITRHLGDEATKRVRNIQDGHTRALFWVMAHRMDAAGDLVCALAQSPEIFSAWENRNGRTVEQANAVLDRYSYLVPGAVSYLMDLRGLTIASSNRRQTDSFVGHTYQFQPYFQQAVRGEPGSYLAMEVTSKKLGYYASYPVWGRARQIIGVAVFRRPLGAVEEFFPEQSLGFVIDSHGMVVMANRPDMVLKSLWPLSPAIREQVLAFHQFGPGPVTPILTREPVDGAETLFQGERLTAMLQPFPWKDWSIVILSPLRPIVMARLTGIAITLLFCLLLVSLMAIIGLTIDSTARIQSSERRLRESEKRFSDVAENTQEWVWEVDAEGKYTYSSPIVEKLLGYKPEEILDKHFYDLFLPEEREKLKEMAFAAFAAKQAFCEFINRNLHKDGSVVWLSTSGVPILGKTGNLLGYRGSDTNITERRQAEEALRRSERRYRTFVDLTNQFAWVTDSSGQVVEEMPAFRKFTGQSKEETKGTGWATALHPDDLQRTLAVWNQAVSTRTPYEIEYRMRRHDGVYRVLLARGVPILNDDGRVLEWIGTGFDITEREEAEEALQQANAQLQALVRETEERNRQIAAFHEMSDVLQSCRTSEETFAVIGHFLSKFFPFDTGALYLFQDSKDLLIPVTAWGHPPPSEVSFPPQDCWAIRSGRIYRVTEPGSDLLCWHCPGNLPAGYLCVPLVAQGEALGILHIRVLSCGIEAGEKDLEAKQWGAVAVTVAENLALALANLRLRETLQKQAMRDPLTGLFNRRYLEETLDRELHRARRQEAQMGVVMIDLDRFKTFNDTYGHVAGDALLSALANVLTTGIRSEDIACRYGGEEFLLLMPGASLAITRDRAETLRQEVKNLQVNYQGRFLKSTTISIGVAIFPDHGHTAEEVIAAADAALYRAKQAGRDRVEIASLNSPAAAAP